MIACGCTLSSHLWSFSREHTFLHNASEDSRHSASGGAHPAGETFTLALADTSLVVAAQHIKDADDALKDAITFLRRMEAFWFDSNVRMVLEAVWFARESLCRAQSC